jgi:hypothetical protein
VDAEQASAELISSGACVLTAVNEVGEAIIENPRFKLQS